MSTVCIISQLTIGGGGGGVGQALCAGNGILWLCANENTELCNQDTELARKKLL